MALTLLWGLVVIGAVSTGSVAAMPGAPANLLALAFVLLATGCSIAVVLYLARNRVYAQ